MLALARGFGQTADMAAPAVSVLIIAHNRAHTIGAAVRSVLRQTFTDFELIVVDDGSTDGTVHVVQALAEPRLRLVRTAKNEGIPAARNRALGEARGDYIAWLDSDDLCHPERLAMQLEHLQKHPELSMIGSAARKININNRMLAGGRSGLRTHQQIRALLLFRSPFQQSSVFGRADALRAMPYDPDFPVCEDVDMFARFTEQHLTANLPLFLIARRVHPGQTVRQNVDRIIDRQMAISARLLAPLDMTLTAEDLRRHVLIGGARGDLGEDVVEWTEHWFEQIVRANNRHPKYDPAALCTSFQFVLIKAALRLLRRNPVQARHLFGLARKYSDKVAAIVFDLGQALLPFASRPSATGFRSLLEG